MIPGRVVDGERRRGESLLDEKMRRLVSLLFDRSEVERPRELPVTVTEVSRAGLLCLKLRSARYRSGRHWLRRETLHGSCSRVGSHLESSCPLVRRLTYRPRRRGRAVILIGFLASWPSDLIFSWGARRCCVRVGSGAMKLAY